MNEDQISALIDKRPKKLMVPAYGKRKQKRGKQPAHRIQKREEYLRRDNSNTNELSHRTVWGR
jgi:hypothetical protein